MNTVKCPECFAEQEIYVNSEKEAVCAFCGAKITDLPEDFNPSDYIKSDNDISQYDEISPVNDILEGLGEEISVEYTLSFDDVKTALDTTGKSRKGSTMNIVETVLIALYFAFQIYTFIKQGRTAFNAGSIIMMVVMALLIPGIWVLPKVYEKKYINSIADGTKLFAKIYEDVMYVNVEGASKPTIVKFDKTSALFDTDERFLIVIPDGSIIILPKRYLENDLEKITKRINEGTREATEEDKKRK